MSKRLVRTVMWVVLGCVLAVPLVRAGQVYALEWSYVHPNRGSLSVPLDQAGLSGVREVRIPGGASGDSVAGWYLPPTHGTLVIVAHGTQADRSSMLAEMRILASAGLGVLAFDWPGYGLSGGNPASDESARAALRAVISWASLQPGVESDSLAGLGFSFGGYRMAQVAASDPRIRRVALLGVPADGDAVTYHFYRRWTPLAGWLAIRIERHLGLEPDSLKPGDLIHRLSPRPVLVVAGDSDITVPVEMSRAVFTAAREPKQWVLVRGATHGGYAAAPGGDYAERLVSFFGGREPAVPAVPDSAKR